MDICIEALGLCEPRKGWLLYELSFYFVKRGIRVVTISKIPMCDNKSKIILHADYTVLFKI